MGLMAAYYFPVFLANLGKPDFEVCVSGGPRPGGGNMVLGGLIRWMWIFNWAGLARRGSGECSVAGPWPEMSSGMFQPGDAQGSIGLGR